MKVILLNRHAASRTIELGKGFWALVSVCFIGLPLGLVALSYQVGFGEGVSSEQASRVTTQEQQASERAEALAQLGAEAQSRLSAMTRRLASLQAHVTRLDALGSHLIDLAGLDTGEFDFSGPPALGGPAQPLTPLVSHDVAEVEGELSALDAVFARREAQFDVLAGLLSSEQLRRESTPAGRPIRSGWQSSPFGNRIDPMTGQPGWHEGADFAGREGSDILAVASGVVSRSGYQAGYGSMVEVSHGDGLSTRYAHNKENLVAVGDLVRRGDVIALMGSTGRSTGPHVHFEVFKYGRVVDPASYIRRTHR
ncbi:MAG: M23 family metallopeptidase [Luminiphilus sp.]|nr:M23 family metallopeptidase [Luminiphilus sp.]